MFENIGSKIKMIAIIWFILSAVLCIILAFTLGFIRYYDETEMIPVIFFPLLIGGPIVAYISSLLLAGFGALIEYTQKIYTVILSCDNGIRDGSKGIRNSVDNMNVTVHHIHDIFKGEDAKPQTDNAEPSQTKHDFSVFSR